MYMYAHQMVFDHCQMSEYCVLVAWSKWSAVPVLLFIHTCTLIIRVIVVPVCISLCTDWLLLFEIKLNSLDFQIFVSGLNGETCVQAPSPVFVLAVHVRVCVLFFCIGADRMGPSWRMFPLCRWWMLSPTRASVAKVLSAPGPTASLLWRGRTARLSPQPRRCLVGYIT